MVDVGRTVGSPCPPGEVVHPTAAYDLLVGLVICGIMLFARRRLSARTGTMASRLVILYGLNRLTLDVARADDRRWGLTGSRWAGIAAMVIGVTGLVWLARHPRDDAAGATGG